MKQTHSALLVGICLLASLLAQAAPPTAEAQGEILDRDGNPVADVVVVFTAVGNPDVSYKGKTNKKGKFWVSGLLTPSGDHWKIVLESETHLATNMVVESRTVNKVLLGNEPFRKTLRPGEEIPEIVIRPLGTARVQFTMITLEQAQDIEAAEVAEAQAAAEAAAEEQAEIQAQADPWNSALSHVEAGDLEGSVELFEKAVDKEPDSAERYQVYAKVLYQLERMDEAALQATRAIDLAPGEVDARMVLYGVYASSGRMDDALTVLDEARQVDGNNVQILEQIAYVALEQGNSAEAIEAHERIVEIDPAATESWLALGDLYAATGETEKSEQAYSRVIDLDPSNAHQIFFNIGALMMNKAERSDAETQSAISAFRKAVEIKPDYAPAYQQLAFALLGAGDRNGAKGSLEKYVHLAPQAPDAAQMQALIENLD